MYIKKRNQKRTVYLKKIGTKKEPSILNISHRVTPPDKLKTTRIQTIPLGSFRFNQIIIQKTLIKLVPLVATVILKMFSVSTKWRKSVQFFNSPPITCPWYTCAMSVGNSSLPHKENIVSSPMKLCLRSLTIHSPLGSSTSTSFPNTMLSKKPSPNYCLFLNA